MALSDLALITDIGFARKRMKGWDFDLISWRAAVALANADYIRPSRLRLSRFNQTPTARDMKPSPVSFCEMRLDYASAQSFASPSRS
jgi:hypothetical protein